MFVAALLATVLTFSVVVPDIDDIPGLGPEGVFPESAWTPTKINQLPSRHTVPDLTPDELNKMWSDSPNKNPSPAEKRGEAKKVGGKFKGGGSTVLSSFMLAYDVGTGIANYAGLPTSGSWSCDLTRVFNSGSRCAVGAVPDYVPNSDILDVYVPPGWDAPPVFNLPPVDGSGGRQISASKTTILDITSADGNLWEPVTQFDFVCGASAPSGFWFVPLNVTWWYYDADGFERLVSNGQRLGADCNGAQRWENPFNRLTDKWSTISRIQFNVNTSQHSGSAGSVIWYSPNNPDRPEEMNPAPERAWVIEGQCMAGNPFSVSSGWFFETGEWEPMPTIPCDPSSVTVKQKVAGYEDQIISTWNIPTQVQDWATDNPDGSKKLDLLRIGGITEPISCFSGTDLCSPEWYLEMDKNTKYQCQYGGVAVALEECNVYRPTFNPQKTKQGVRYADKDGKLPDIKPNLKPGGIEISESQGGECFPSGWGVFNPADWILKPIKCAFIPRTQVLTQQITAVRVALANSPIGGLVSLVQPPVVPSGQSCGVIADVNVPNFGRIKIDSCDWVAWAPIVRNFLHWIILAFGIYGIVFWILRKVTRDQVSEVNK